jgi:hypothetical protein
MLAIAALSATALLAVWVSARRGADNERVATEAPSPARAPRLAAGRIEVGGQPLEQGAPIAAGTLARSRDSAARLVLDDASIVHAEAHTSLVFADDTGGEERIELRQGRVSLQVNARARRAPLIVETAELSARVVGTRFDVTRVERDARMRTTVRVHEGHVRVVAHADGAQRLLAAGEHITVNAAGTAEPRAAAEAEPVTGERTTATSRADDPAAGAREPAASTPRAHAQPRPLSVEVRRRLRTGEVDAARRLLRRAEHARTLGSLELALLQAEADLAEHRHERAKSRYLEIATRHPDSPEAELSLFAAAQLSRGQAGIDILQRYLARYPNGRFAKEAHRLLQALDRP